MAKLNSLAKVAASALVTTDFNEMNWKLHSGEFRLLSPGTQDSDRKRHKPVELAEVGIFKPIAVLDCHSSGKILKVKLYKIYRNLNLAKNYDDVTF